MGHDGGKTRGKGVWGSGMVETRKGTVGPRSTEEGKNKHKVKDLFSASLLVLLFSH